jgi:hypothetical protein
MRSILIKIVATLVVLTGLGFLFVRSVRSARSAPYTVDRRSLRDWTVAIEPAAGPHGAMLVLRAAPDLAMGLSRQVFKRAMESLSSPAAPAIPLVLQSEFDRAFAGHTTPDALADAARAAGLESTAPEPRCLAYRRISDPGVTRQLYFVLFDAPAFTRFREQIGALLNATAPGADFDPGALSPVLFISETDPSFTGWLPLRANPTTDCVAPIVTS